MAFDRQSAKFNFLQVTPDKSPNRPGDGYSQQTNCSVIDAEAVLVNVVGGSVAVGAVVSDDVGAGDGVGQMVS